MTVMGLWASLDEIILRRDALTLRKRLVKGADTNKKTSSKQKRHRAPLHAACLCGHLESAELLLSFGADVDARDEGGQTPLHYAARNCHLDILDLLLSWGADHLMPDNEGLLPAHLAESLKGRPVRDRLSDHSLHARLEVCYFESGKWMPYDATAAKAVGYEMGGGSTHCALATMSGSTYIVDFKEQLQINVESFFAKSIAWRVPPRGRWNYPPTPFQGLHAAIQDARLLAPYAPLLANLRHQGLLPPPTAEHTQPSQKTSPPPRKVSPTMRESKPSQSRAEGGVRDAGRGRRNEAPAAAAAVLPPPPLLFLLDDHHHVHNPVSKARPIRPPPLPLLGAEFVTSPSPNLQPSFLLQHPPRNATSSPSNIPPPPPLDPSKPHFLSARPPMFKSLRSDTEEYADVVLRFRNGMEKPSRQQGGRGGPIPGLRPVTVTSIHAVRAPSEGVDAFERASVEVAGRRGSANEKLGWHGAPFSSLEHIVLKGFRLLPDARNGRLYGQGVYFAPQQHAYTSAEFAVADSSGEKHMLLCRVLLGAMEAVPFDSSQRTPSTKKFDTGADNVKEPTRYILWERDVNKLVLPTHVVSFKYC